jgi:hypothetical protein
MPAKSKKQFKYMKAVEHGSIKDSSLTKEQAKEYTESNKGKKAYKKLPDKKKPKKKDK